MRWDCATRYNRLTRWHRWFAWYPVKIADLDYRWLEYVMRRGSYVLSTKSDYWVWEYRP